METINLWTWPNTWNGDTLRAGWEKINDNFAELDAGKQDTLVSTTNIKSINWQSILWSGDLAVTPADGSITEAKLSTSVNTSLDKADTALQSSDIGTAVQGYSAVLAGTTASFTTADETKLDGIEAGAEVNNISDTNATDLTDGWDTTLHTHDADRNRANHTGTQTASTISNFNESVEDLIGTKIIAGANTTVTYNDATGETTIASTGGGGGGGWSGDVTWPASSVNNSIAVFDWTTGKVIKDWLRTITDLENLMIAYSIAL